MVRVCTEGIITFSLLLTFLVPFSTRVRAVDIYVWDKPSCKGTAVYCPKIAESTCCGTIGGNFPFPSMSFANPIECIATYGFVGGSCASLKLTAFGGCMDCTAWGGCTGAKFNSQCPTGGQCSAHCLQSDGLWSKSGNETGEFWSKSGNETSKCVTPSGFFYREDGMKGYWTMASSNTTEQMELKNLPQEEKVNWLKSHGATYIDFDIGT